MKKLLFIGASGPVATKVIPHLVAEYEIVGFSRRKKDLAAYCLEHLTFDLLKEGPAMLEEVFRRYVFDAVIWNAVAYFPKSILENTREELHTEFDLAVALPLVCISCYAQTTQPAKKRFVAVTSQLAYGHKVPWSSYAIAKNATIQLIEHVAQESEIHCVAIAPGRVSHISTENMLRAIHEALSTSKSGAVLRVDEDIREAIPPQ